MFGKYWQDMTKHENRQTEEVHNHTLKLSMVNNWFFFFLAMSSCIPVGTIFLLADAPQLVYHVIMVLCVRTCLNFDFERACARSVILLKMKRE